MRISIYHLILVFSLFSYHCIGQSENYFQQALTYDLDATIDDKDHSLSADFKINYTNNSGQALSYIIIHLWANAYSDKSSDFTKQLVDLGDRSFYFAKPDQMGGYQNIFFVSEGDTLSFENWEGKPDVIKLNLPKILPTGKTITITGDYRLRIPESFSRMGRGDSSYQISQWYPKPAVFDHNGWHPMPYLQFGEYYSEFAQYSVRITCPADYVVAATGRLRTKKEREVLLAMAKDSTSYPSVQGMKTLHYTAENVHDFAFFMDKRWLVEKEELLIQDRPVEAWSFYTPRNKNDWKGSAFKVARAIEFLSEKVGAYPYPHATAVDGVLSVGGGMEYPMITLIGEVAGSKMLDQVIAHEVTHNWFYGILASNERRYPWMDEGPTSYYEKRYMDEFYPDDKKRGFLPTNHSGYTETELGYLLESRRAMDMPSDLHSEKYDELAYGISAYAKPQLALSLLEAYYTKERLDQAFKDYYDRFGFRHVQPEDLQQSLEQTLDDDLGWWFKGVIGSRGITDYCIHKVRSGEHGSDIQIRNKGSVAAPIILGNDKGEISVFPGIKHDTIISVKHDGESGTWEIDPGRKTLDAYDHNNVYRTNSLFSRLEPLSVKFVPGIPAREKSYLYMYPVTGWNQFDHWMTGVHISNMGLLPKKFSFQLTPLYSFTENELSGLGRMYYNHRVREGSLRNIQIGVEGRRFNHRDARGTDDVMSYSKVGPFITLKLMGDRKRQVHHDIHYRWENLWEEIPIYNDIGEYLGASDDERSRHYLSYQYGRHGGLHPQHLLVELEYGKYDVFRMERSNEYLRLGVTGEKDWFYGKLNKIKARAFVGVFLYNDARESNSINTSLARRSFGLTYEAHNDFYDEMFLGRTAQSGFLSRQVGLREGGFKTAFTPPERSNIANSNDWIASVNLIADLPGESIALSLFKPFLDLGYYSPQTPGGAEDPDPFLWSTGISLHLMSGVFQFHLPLLNSSNINDQLDLAGQDQLWKRISFTFSFQPNQFYHFLENTRLNF